MIASSVKITAGPYSVNPEQLISWACLCRRNGVHTLVIWQASGNVQQDIEIWLLVQRKRNSCVGQNHDLCIASKATMWPPAKEYGFFFLIM